jgi:hypothetical protein
VQAQGRGDWYAEYTLLGGDVTDQRHFGGALR